MTVQFLARLCIHNGMDKNEIHILLTEDNAAEARLFEIARELSGLDHYAKLDIATDGEEAILKLELSVLHERHYDLLIVDLNMPRTNGREVIAHLHDFPYKPTCIVLSNSNSAADIRESKELGADGYVQKPANFSDMEAFCAVLKECIEKHNSVPIECVKAKYDNLH